jgi:hypothetical protein
LLDTSFVIWELDGSPASTGNHRAVHQAVMAAAAGLSEDASELLARLASHTAASISSTLRRFAADQLPGGQNTKVEVEKRFSPAEMECFPDMPASDNISEGILGMTKSAHRKAPNTDARSINGKVLWRTNNVAADVAAMPPDERAKVLQ